jgi:hypothetical protein
MLCHLIVTSCFDVRNRVIELLLELIKDKTHAELLNASDLIGAILTSLIGNDWPLDDAIKALNIVDLSLQESRTFVGVEKLRDISWIIRSFRTLRKPCMHILKSMSKFDLNRIDQKIFFSMLSVFLQNRSFVECWCDMLSMARLLIGDHHSANFVLFENGFFEVGRHLLNEKYVNIVVSAIYLIGEHFLYSNENVDIDLPRIVHICGSSKNSAARAGFWLLSNVIVNDRHLISKLIELGIFDQLQVAFDEGNLRRRFEAMSLMAMMIIHGTRRELVMLIDRGFVKFFAQSLGICTLKFVTVCVECLLHCSEVEEKHGLLLNEFTEQGGFQSVENLIESENAEISRLAAFLMDVVERIRNNLMCSRNVTARDT